ncbi:uncharacterized protein [Solanum tuberosum]|uniref:uncharacterized protein n=1 Tax=Solanum tuberosum TaxID=4113 RepID=UPI00073A0AE7|nr:PREDICTED: uncharacterized protein LOC107058751 [Solanum tuberosum]
MLHEINARYIRFLKIEDSILKQKTQLQWFKEGDCNTKYFHSLVRGRKKRLFIHKITREDEVWIQGDDVIAEAACDHFQKIFTGDNKLINEGALDCIPLMVNQEKNDSLTALPNLEELKEVVFSMNPNSAAGPDGMNGYFFQKCWHMIKHDLLGVTQAFFCGQMIPKYFFHSCIVLLPKVKNPNKLSEFRPISLSNFTSKIISKLVSSRLGPILPSLVSLNQSGFIKGRSISENIMLAQEIIHQIKKPNIGSNVIIKLDMAKAYDRVSWSYICLVLRRMGFDEVLIDMIWRIMANNCFADDIILFTSGRQKTLKLIMQTLQSYEQSSGQLVNTDKSHFMVHSCAFNSTKDRIKRITGFRITGWQTKLLRYGGRAILVKHVLHFLPIHLLASVTPPVTVLRQIQSITADFFWGWRTERKKYRWSSWKKLSFPYDEGGVGMRNLKDVCLAFQYKQWWIFRSKQTLWGYFLKAKYCQRSNPISKKWDTGESLTWKHLMHNKLQVEKHIQWKLNSGNCSFWWDNWLCIGPIAHYSTDSNRFNNTTVADFRLEGQWNWSKLLQQAPNSQLASILSTEFSTQQDLPDLAIWKPRMNGNFSCSSAWNEIREMRTKTKFNSFIWSGLDTIEHIFNTGQFATYVWRSFADAPPARWVKINTDGSALSNPGRIGAGGILRDQMGAMLLAFATPLGEGTNNQAEIGAAIFGMTWVLQLGYKNVVLEVDSQLLVDWITQKAKPPWSISIQLQQLQELIRQTHNFRCKHNFREANFVANSLSKQSHKLTSPQIYCSNQQLPKEARAYYQLEMIEMASFRRRKIKRIKEPP